MKSSISSSFYQMLPHNDAANILALTEQVKAQFITEELSLTLSDSLLDNYNLLVYSAFNDIIIKKNQSLSLKRLGVQYDLNLALIFNDNCLSAFEKKLTRYQCENISILTTSCLFEYSNIAFLEVAKSKYHALKEQYQPTPDHTSNQKLTNSYELEKLKRDYALLEILDTQPNLIYAIASLPIPACCLLEINDLSLFLNSKTITSVFRKIITSSKLAPMIQLKESYLKPLLKSSTSKQLQCALLKTLNNLGLRIAIAADAIFTFQSNIEKRNKISNYAYFKDLKAQSHLQLIHNCTIYNYKQYAYQSTSKLNKLDGKQIKTSYLFLDIYKSILQEQSINDASYDVLSLVESLIIYRQFTKAKALFKFFNSDKYLKHNSGQETIDNASNEIFKNLSDEVLMSHLANVYHEEFSKYLESLGYCTYIVLFATYHKEKFVCENKFQNAIGLYDYNFYDNEVAIEAVANPLGFAKINIPKLRRLFPTLTKIWH